MLWWRLPHPHELMGRGAEVSRASGAAEKGWGVGGVRGVPGADETQDRKRGPGAMPDPPLDDNAVSV